MNREDLRVPDAAAIMSGEPPASAIHAEAYEDEPIILRPPWRPRIVLLAAIGIVAVSLAAAVLLRDGFLLVCMALVCPLLALHVLNHLIYIGRRCAIDREGFRLSRGRSSVSIRWENVQRIGGWSAGGVGIRLVEPRTLEIIEPPGPQLWSRLMRLVVRLLALPTALVDRRALRYWGARDEFEEMEVNRLLTGFDLVLPSIAINRPANEVVTVMRRRSGLEQPAATTRAHPPRADEPAPTEIQPMQMGRATVCFILGMFFFLLSLLIFLMFDPVLDQALTGALLSAGIGGMCMAMGVAGFRKRPGTFLLDRSGLEIRGVLRNHRLPWTSIDRFEIVERATSRLLIRLKEPDATLLTSHRSFPQLRRREDHIWEIRKLALDRSREEFARLANVFLRRYGSTSSQPPQSADVRTTTETH